MGRSQSSASLFLLFSACVVCLYGEPADECLTAINIGNNRRSAKNVLGSQEQPLSDIAISPTAWYRLDSLTGYKVPGSCVTTYHCGTNSPIWINGTHPTADTPGPVTLKACSQLRCDGDCCAWAACVQVKWCKNSTTGQEYFAYRLTPPPVPAMAYCAGETTYCGVSCTWEPQTSTCNCPAVPPMRKPILSPAYLTAAKTALDPAGNSFVATKFSINCTVGYPRQEVDDGARFDVSFEANGVQFAKFVATTTNPFVILDEHYLNGHLGTVITCKVYPYWHSKEQSVFQVSDGRWFGIKPYTESGEEITTRVVLQEGQVFRFKMIANFPITAPDCFNMSLDIPCHPYYTFKIYARRDGRIDACAFELTPSSNASDFITIMPEPSIGTRAKNFTWEIAFEKKTENTIFYNFEIQNVTVLIEDPVPRPLCKSTGDPHINTFPVGEPKTSRFYHNYQVGDFYLVKSTTRLLEIQVRHFVCTNTNNATCNCGLMVREGNNIVGIDNCQPEGKTPTGWDPRLIRLLVDKTFPSGSITLSQTGWVIKMLSGVEIKADRGLKPGIFDIYVIGLNSDNYTGLCSYKAPSEVQCTTECEQYRVPEEESFFNINSKNLPKCNESYSLPACDCYAREGDSYCNVTDLQLDQSNLLKTNLTCLGSTQFQVINEENHLDISIIIDVIVRPHPTIETNVVFVWPTPKNKITQEQATAQCKQVLSNSTAQSVCGSRSDIDVASMMKSCELDIQIADDLMSAISISTQFETSCKYSIESSVVETNNPTDKSQEIINKTLEELHSLICPRQCSQRGTCVNGTCTCYPGFSGKYCGLIVGQVPEIKNLLVNACDIKQSQCSQIYVNAVNVSMSETLTCKLNSTIDGIQFDYSPMVGRSVIICSLPTKPNVDVYYVSLSNDRKDYSGPVKFVVFSSEDSMPTA